LLTSSSKAVCFVFLITKNKTIIQSQNIKVGGDARLLGHQFSANQRVDTSKM